MAESLQSGSVLVADGLSDPNFVDTIAVVILYSVHGTSLGVVVNRPLMGGPEQLTHGELKDVLAAVQPSVSTEPQEFFRIGGPMPSSPIFLHRLGDTGTRVHQDLYTGGDLDVISAALLRGRRDFRAYIGHAAWGPGQLEDEVAKGAWRLQEPDPELPFMN